MPTKNLFRASTLLSAIAASALTLHVDAKPINNPVDDNNITIDGKVNDWVNAASLGYDKRPLPNPDSEADFLEGWLAHDNENFYIAYRNNGDIKTSAWWSWQIYLDTDASTDTGYNRADRVGSLGADYLLQGAGLYKYTAGSGSSWSWEYIKKVDNAIDGAIAEFKIPRQLLGNPANTKTVFKARNFAFTGIYSASDIDAYPRPFSPIPMHNELLFKQSAIWGEPRGILPMRLTNDAAAGASQLEMDDSYPLLNNQLISYRASNGKYFTAHIDTVNGADIKLKKPLLAPISSGQNVWNFYNDSAHPNDYGYRAMVDFAIRKIGINKINSGRHVMFGDSWFDSHSDAFASYLSNRLGSNAVVINKAVGGSMATDLLRRFNSAVPPENPDFVWITVGNNDYHRDAPTETYLAAMKGIISKINSIGAQSIIYDSSVGELFGGSDVRTQLSHSYSDALARDNNYFDYKFGPVTPSPETSEISNAKTILIDGDFTDWAGISSFGLDGNDLTQTGSPADILEAWMAHDDDNFYMAYRNKVDIDEAKVDQWRTYLDTDNDETTGYTLGNGVGADFLIKGKQLYRYTGSGTDTKWQVVVQTSHSIGGSDAEFALPRSALGNPTSLSAIMKTRNGVFTGNYSATGKDSYPNVGSGHFNYQFTQ